MDTLFNLFQAARSTGIGAARTVRCRFMKTGSSRRSGDVFGQGVGNSVEFRDYRLYQAGDDPRSIDWRASARTSAVVLRRFQEEFVPEIDLLLDASTSMWIFEEKARRAFEILHFLFESARIAHTKLRFYVPCEDTLLRLPLDEASQGSFLSCLPTGQYFSDCDGVPSRPGSVRIIVSDLLYPLREAQDGLWRAAFVLSPYAREEEVPDWRGNIELEGCEGEGLEERSIDEGVVGRFQENYRTHFMMWARYLLRIQSKLCRVSSEGGLVQALTGTGEELFELWRSY